MYVSPQGASDERAFKLLPRQGSEDASHLLTYPQLPQHAAPADSSTLYFANERFDWIVWLKPTHALTRQEVQTQFDAPWQQSHGAPQLFGRSTRDSRWTYLIAADADSVFSEIAISWKLYDERTATPRAFGEPELRAFQQDVESRASSLPARVSKVNFSPARAAALSQELAHFVSANNVETLIVLKAAAPFKGLAIWDSMMSLGLHWGDMDLFHWENPDSDAGGGDHLFSVSTSTEPGYFLPEHLAKGEVRTEDLIFSFSIPRTAGAKQVLLNMHKAASYCQQKLGGKLVNADGSPFDLKAEMQKCTLVEQNLHRKQLQPGYGDALYLF